MVLVVCAGFAAAAVLVALLCGGGVLFWNGLRGQPVDSHQHCAACQFDLHGHVRLPERCPDCGSSLWSPTAIGAARRTPQFRSLGAGAALMLASLGPIAALAVMPPTGAEAALSPPAAPQPVAQVSAYDVPIVQCSTPYDGPKQRRAQSYGEGLALLETMGMPVPWSPRTHVLCSSRVNRAAELCVQ